MARTSAVEKRSFEQFISCKAHVPGRLLQQILVCPCYNPPILLYSLLCCCCAMGDVGCYVRDNWLCYPAYCLAAPCPCCVGETRERVAEEYNLPVSTWEPDDCGWCVVKMIGVRLMCFASVCIFPCFHVAQMRAEVAFRKHGKATICPCCCCFCGGGDGPGEPSEDTDLDYPRMSGQDYSKPDSGARVEADYPRAERVLPAPVKVEAPVYVDYPRN